MSKYMDKKTKERQKEILANFSKKVFEDIGFKLLSTYEDVADGCYAKRKEFDDEEEYFFIKIKITDGTFTFFFKDDPGAGFYDLEENSYYKYKQFRDYVISKNQKYDILKASIAGQEKQKRRKMWKQHGNV